MEYGYLAGIYDHLMKDVDYEAWVDFTEKQIGSRKSSGDINVLELACGTGNITIPLGKRGYKITAVDRSIEMLSRAQQKATELCLNLQFLQQDMLSLEINSGYDAILCFCDGVNYILDSKDLVNFFRKTYSLLNENGVFIFDISSFYKLKHILGCNTYGEDLGNTTYLWENYFDEESETVEMDLTFFELKEKGLYEKHKEFHVQKAHHQDVVKKFLLDVGFSAVGMYHEFNGDTVKKDSHRIFFVCEKLPQPR